MRVQVHRAPIERASARVCTHLGVRVRIRVRVRVRATVRFRARVRSPDLDPSPNR